MSAPLNLKNRAVAARYMSKSLDAMLELAARNGYSCHVVYNDCPDVPAKNARELVLHVDEATGVVTRIC